MEITFAKTAQRDYDVFIRRDDGVLLQLTSYDRPLRLPHDIAHFVVEHELKLEYGLWGLLAAGVMFSNVRVVSGRPRRYSAERFRSMLKKVKQQPVEAEVLVSVMLKIAEERSDKEWHAAKAQLDAVWKPHQSQLQRPLDHGDVRRVCIELRKVEGQWQALPVGESLTVTWALNNKHLKSIRR